MPDRTYVTPTTFRRPLVFLGERVKSPPFSDEARKKAGELLALVQEGEELGMPRSRPLPVIGPRCHELRIEDGDLTWRIVYRVDPTAVLVPVLFAKKTRSLPRRTIDLCQRRLAEYDEQQKRKR